MRVKYLAQEHNAVPRPGLEPGQSDPESSALTIRPLHLPILQKAMYKLHLQYRSKVSYHLSSRFSRDESLVSRESLKRIFWNKLGAIMLREND